LLARPRRRVRRTPALTLIFWINLPLRLAAFLITGRALKRCRATIARMTSISSARLDVRARSALLLAAQLGRLATLPSGQRRLDERRRLFALFFWRIATRRPFVPLSIMRNRVVTTRSPARRSACTMIRALDLHAVYFETCSASRRAGGLMLIPFMAAPSSARLRGQMMSRLKHYKRVALVACRARSRLLPLALSPRSSMSRVAALLFTSAAAIGPCFPITTVSVQNAVLRGSSAP